MKTAQEHWNEVYRTRGPLDVSWYQARPTVSLKLVAASGVGVSDGIIDVGGGASVLVDFLLDAGYQRVAVLDISSVAIEHARERLGERAGKVEWLETDVTEVAPSHRIQLWHDRAVFHFLTDGAARRKYVEAASRTVTPGGGVIIATFSLEGPRQCSGLDVVRYDAAGLSKELGPAFQLVEQADETHVTPWNTAQRFSYFRFRFQPGESQ